MSTHGCPVGWDPRVSMKFLKPGDLTQFAYDTDYNDNPKYWSAYRDDPRLPQTRETPARLARVYAEDVFIVLDAFHYKSNTYWLDVLHPKHGRIFIRGHYEIGDIDPARRMFVQV